MPYIEVKLFQHLLLKNLSKPPILTAIHSNKTRDQLITTSRHNVGRCNPHPTPSRYAKGAVK
jgi:hypothetical protein